MSKNKNTGLTTSGGAPASADGAPATSAAPGNQPETNKPNPPKAENLTPQQAAAKFAGIPVDQVFDFKADGDRFVVVSVSGRKITRTPAEREADAREVAAAAAKKAAAKARK